MPVGLICPTDIPYHLFDVTAWQLTPSQTLVNRVPGWSKLLDKWQAQQQLPVDPITLSQPTKVYSTSQLEHDVLVNPSRWCDGTGPSDAPLQGLKYATLCAGEIACLLAGLRGVVMVQCHVGWDQTAPQPVYNPLVLFYLQQALTNAQIQVHVSAASGGLGLTAILCANKEPFKAWGAHLASFGAQAALVADSPFYKLLIGRVMGYKEVNIIHHIKMTNGRSHPAPEVVAAVSKEMSKLSSKKPQIPWNKSSRGKQQPKT
eukprot:jgi/Chrzof1/1853/Cz10g23220.t1